MSKIVNEWPTSDEKAIAYRKKLADHAEESAKLVMEMEASGEPYEEARRARSRAAGAKSADTFRAKMTNTDDLRQWGEQMTVPLGVEAFGMEVLENNEDCFAMDMHFCPHLKGWQQLGLSDEMCAKLCDMAMESDNAMAKEMGYDFQNPMRLADGDPVCRVIYRRKNKPEEK